MRFRRHRVSATKPLRRSVAVAGRMHSLIAPIGTLRITESIGLPKGGLGQIIYFNTDYLDQPKRHRHHFELPVPKGMVD